MLRINPIAKTTLRLLNSLPRYRFCINGYTLDPSKHITMNHNPNNMYTDAIDIGVYQDLPNINSIASRNYESKILQATASALNKKYGSSISADQLDGLRSKPWTRVLKKHIKTQDQLISVQGSILNQLALKVIVRQSRWTWVLQQKYRLLHSQKVLANRHFDTVEQFIEAYNQLIEELVLFSNLGHSKITQAPSALEKHFAQQMSESQTRELKLENTRPQNNNLINRFMKYIHS